MELRDVSSEVVADNTKPVTAIPINSPRWINKVLLEVEKGVLLAIDATKLRVRVRVSDAENEEEVRNKEKEGKEKEWNGS